MDVDGSGLPTRYEAATDGVLVLRYLLGLRGVSLVNNARALAARRATLRRSQIATSMPASPQDGHRWRRRGTCDVGRVADSALHARPRGAALIEGPITAH